MSQSPGQVIVVRHAQASFGTDDYDRLSTLGHEQARLLGEYLAHDDIEPFAAVACGSHRRHDETWAAIDAAFRARGRAPLQAACLPALDEFNHHAVLEAHTKTSGHRLSPDAGASKPEDLRAVYEYLRAGLGRWAAGELEEHLDEGWYAFKDRVRSATEELIALSHRHPRVLVVTSGGVAAQFAAIALELSDARAVELNLAVRNSAIAEFRVIDGALRLGTWNTLPHLAAPEHRRMWTYY